MKGSKGHELEADVPAAELWKIYGTLRFVELVHELLPQVLHQVEVVRGDGGVGTVIKVSFPPGGYIRMATELTKAMKGSLCHEFETGLPAADVWEVYGGLRAGYLVPQLLPEVFSKVELVEGDGGDGTVLLVTFPPGTPGSEAFKEKFIKVDNENYIKEALVTEGGFLDHGFQKYLVRIEIIGKEEKTSIIRSTIEFEVDREHANNPPVVSTSGWATIAEAITKYIKEQKGLE
ncbi:hypothetical protein BAE44_0025234 [Dichanthelium oligosanthes]|uniref:Bet v I/Major latex protein domain-containing protein n=1 Tax=Dichanthelium oligosanthes TaxID=888268 RepID=A0A1E5ULK1_9POAL|nr:hypothetical protein BAE44_0025234 [Dichanthelium oligosanthes]